MMLFQWASIYRHLEGSDYLHLQGQVVPKRH